MELSGNTYVCSYGETFDSIAKDVYGDEVFAAEILCVNPKLSGKYVLDAGDKINLPLIYTPDNEEDEDDDIVDTAVPVAPWK